MIKIRICIVKKLRTINIETSSRSTSKTVDVRFENLAQKGKQENISDNNRVIKMNHPNQIHSNSRRQGEQ